MATPGLIRARRTVTVRRQRAAEADDAPDGGWLGQVDGLVVLHGRPPAAQTLAVAIEAALLAGTTPPSDQLVDWLAEEADGDLVWNDEARAAFDELLRSGNRRAWRLLDATGVLSGALPDLADELAHRRRDTSVLDPAHLLRWPTVEELAGLEHGDDRDAAATFGLLATAPLLRLAALAVDLSGEHDDVTVTAGDLGKDLGLGAADVAELVATASDAGLLRATASHLAEVPLGPGADLVAHVGSLERARRLYLLDLALGDLPTLQRETFDHVAGLLVDELARRGGEGTTGADEVDRRRRAALELADDPRTSARIGKAPRALVVSLEPAELVADVALLADGVPAPGLYRVGVHPTGDGWRVAVAGGDQPGLLARVAAALGDAGLSVERATVASFGDRGVLDVFWVTGSTAPDPDALAGGILDAFRAPRRLDRVDGVEVTLDNEASPWFTVCTVVGPDRPGLLADLAAAISADGVVVHGARLASSEGTVVDRFDLSDRKGRKLDAAAVEKVAGRLGAASSAGTA